LIKSNISNRIAFVELARLDKKNALTGDMYGQLADAIAGADKDPQVRVVLLRGAPDCFCAGNDVGDFLKRPPLVEGSPSARFFVAMQEIRKPIVAAVGGPAVGIGTTMLLHCDLVYAASDARFQMPFVPLGITPEFGSTYILPLLAGYQRAAELLLLGQPFTRRRRARSASSPRWSPEKSFREREGRGRACRAAAGIGAADQAADEEAPRADRARDDRRGGEGVRRAARLGRGERGDERLPREAQA
jgi:hypothetical protein